MSAKITTAYGHAVPPAPRHSVTFHIPLWSSAENFGKDPKTASAALHNVYPRLKPHRDIVSLTGHVLKLIGLEDHGCLLFSSQKSAEECIEYSTDPRRDNGLGKKPVERDRISLRAFRAKEDFYGVLFSRDDAPVLGPFWTSPGVGVSSRFAEANLEAIDRLVEIELQSSIYSRPTFDTIAHQNLRERIIYHLNRAPLRPELQPRPTSEDVYLFPTGMAAIYKPHSYLSSSHHGTTVLFGMAFANTPQVLSEFGAGYKFFGLGTDDEIQSLESYLTEEQSQGRKVQAIWTEFPANPLLVTPNLPRLRALADQYDTVLIVDDTIGSFANVDVTNMADMIVTSLTKSFNGYADVIAGSVVLNPASQKYTKLKSLFEQHHIPELYEADAEVIVRNSEDYLVRTAKLNHNAASIVDFLQSYVGKPGSPLAKVHYPSLNQSGVYYGQFMRPATAGFTPGYGCLFNVEFEDIESTKVFYDNLNVHMGPHLGAPFTLAMAYTVLLYTQNMDWATQYGLKKTQIRISAGLEDTATLIEDFRIAVEAAVAVKKASKVPDQVFVGDMLA